MERTKLANVDGGFLVVDKVSGVVYFEEEKRKATLPKIALKADKKSTKVEATEEGKTV